MAVNSSSRISSPDLIARFLMRAVMPSDIFLFSTFIFFMLSASTGHNDCRRYLSELVKQIRNLIISNISLFGFRIFRYSVNNITCTWFILNQYICKFNNSNAILDIGNNLCNINIMHYFMDLSYRNFSST